MSAGEKMRPLSARLAELEEAVPAAKRREHECETAHRKIAAEIAQLGDVIADAYADNNEARAAKASKQRAALEQGSLREHEERLEGARRAVQRADAERGLYTRENIVGLLAEELPDAVAAAQDVERDVLRLGTSYGQWSGVATRISSLLRLAGRDTRDMPSFPAELEQLVRDARRAAGVNVPPPVPGGQAMVPLPPAPVAPVNLPRLDAEQKPPTREAA